MISVIGRKDNDNNGLLNTNVFISPWHNTICTKLLLQSDGPGWTEMMIACWVNVRVICFIRSLKGEEGGHICVIRIKKKCMIMIGYCIPLLEMKAYLLPPTLVKMGNRQDETSMSLPWSC